MNTDKDFAKRDRGLLAAALEQAGAKDVHKSQIKCPFHEDHHPSAQIRRAPSGYWNFVCYACDISEDLFAIRARVEGRDVGEILKDAFPRDGRQKHLPVQQREQPTGESFETFDELLAAFKSRLENAGATLQETNRYTDPDTGEFDYCTFRFLPKGATKKSYRQVSRQNGRWYWQAPKGPLPIFNRKRIRECESVLVVEGEKCVRAFTALEFDNIAATTAPRGVSGAAGADWSPLAGKAVYIWRDNDEAGEKYEQSVRDAVLNLSPPMPVRRVRVEDLGLASKGDIVDYLEKIGGTAEEKYTEIAGVLQDSEPLNASNPLAERLALIAEGKYKVIKIPHLPRTSSLSNALLPGTITLLCADPGAGKSFFLLECFWRWTVESNLKVKLRMLEDDKAFHEQRALAQMAGDSDITDIDYCFDNSAYLRETMAKYFDSIETFSRNLECEKSCQTTLVELADWIIKQAEAGYEVIGVDPITAAAATSEPWKADQKFMFRVKDVLERTGARLILATHPRTGQAGKPGLSGAAGGAAYPRFSQSFLWLRNPGEVQRSTVVASSVPLNLDHNRILEIRKARSGKGAGKNIAIDMDYKTLCFEEIGVIKG